VTAAAKDRVLPIDSLYVMGGQQRELQRLMPGPGWYEYQKGLIVRVDAGTQGATLCADYVSPTDAVAEGTPPILFKCGSREGDRLYACTQTEVLVYALPSFERVGYVSLPSFNDVHHVRPTREGTLLVASAGLDLVLEVTLDGRTLNSWNVLGEEPWERFSPEIDYRKVVSTKPHRSHPNYVFCLGEEIWATRFEQKDAICLNRPDRRIDIGLERVHDGVPHEGFVYFTTVNGNLVVVNAQTLKVDEVINLNQMHSEGDLLGWCRGVLVSGNLVWIGFSRVRPTKFTENVRWITHGFKRSLPTHIACYDLTKRQCVREIDLEPYSLSAVFSILPADRTATGES
jgi:hypothetical protein